MMRAKGRRSPIAEYDNVSDRDFLKWNSGGLVFVAARTWGGYVYVRSNTHFSLEAQTHLPFLCSSAAR